MASLAQDLRKSDPSGLGGTHSTCWWGTRAGEPFIRIQISIRNQTAHTERTRYAHPEIYIESFG